MNLKIGIVGLPNVGKSTLFNALVGEQLAQVANFPFCTIEPNLAVVPLPDPRLDKLRQILEVPKKIHATIEFLDVAGLIEGASQGEGLGNQFLGNIRNVQAILHVVRCFEIEGMERPAPKEDIEIINTELALADYQQTEKLIEKLSRQIKGDPKLLPLYVLANEIKDHLSTGTPLWQFAQRDTPTFEELNQNLQFLTAKKVIYIANVDEYGLPDNQYASVVAEIAEEKNSEAITICADLEQGMHSFTPEEQQEYLEMSGIIQTGLDRVIRTSYHILDLISFFTFNEQEVRAWTIQDGWTAPMAAGQIHTDFETGFIRAEVAGFDEFADYKSWSALKTAGVSRSEGRNYVVKDGEVILFRFNV